MEGSKLAYAHALPGRLLGLKPPTLVRIYNLDHLLLLRRVVSWKEKTRGGGKESSERRSKQAIRL